MRKTTILLSITVLVIFGCKPATKHADPGKYADAIQASRSLLDSLLETAKTPGIDIAISVQGELVWSEGFGYADLEHQVPIKAGKTRFRIGSVSKPIAAAALGRLMDQEKIDILKPIQSYVPYFPEKKYPITVKQVAGHIAGIRHYKNEEFLMARHFETVEEGIAIFSSDPLLFEPGEQYSYSSYGFNLISAAVEGASGEEFLDFMQKEVFDPLGMVSTTADKNDSIIMNRASFYELNKAGQFVNARYVDNSYKWAGGGFISTTLDLLKFGEAHMKSGYLSEKTLSELTSSQLLSNGEKTGYGLGWSEGQTDGKRRIGHGGGSIGGITDFIVYPEEEIVIAVVSNSSDTQFGNVIERIVKMFMETDSVHE